MSGTMLTATRTAADSQRIAADHTRALPILGRVTAPPLLERYRDLLARDGEAFPISLGEGATPLIHARRLGAEIGLERLYLKVEGANPPLVQDRGMVSR